MKVGFDYWQVISHYPGYFKQLSELYLGIGVEVHVISAVGQNSPHGSVETAVKRLDVPYTAVHVVVFDHPSGSPALKLEKCQELGITAFYDDRDDVCRELTKNGILAMRVTRKDNSTYDLARDDVENEQK